VPSLSLTCHANTCAVDRPDTPWRASRTHLFTIRLWRESLGDGRVEWRGQVQHVLGGERRVFRDWASLARYLECRLQELDTEEPAK
jgi:hypothetical protein